MEIQASLGGCVDKPILEPTGLWHPATMSSRLWVDEASSKDALLTLWVFSTSEGYSWTAQSYLPLKRVLTEQRKQSFRDPAFVPFAICSEKCWY